MACKECHLAKVRCDNRNIPCTRCVHLSLKCARHESRQGQGPKKRKSKKDAANVSEESVVRLSANKKWPHHYGFHFVIRHWVAIAVSRRSFSLLKMASALAENTGITMDMVLSGENMFDDAHVSHKRGDRTMHYLPDIILKPIREQQTSGDPLQLSEIPTHILKDWKMEVTTAETQRWIFCREIRCGSSRFFLSEAFQKDIISWEKVQQAWEENKQGQEVKDLWMSAAGKPQFAKCLFQLFRHYERPDATPKPVELLGTKIHTASTGEKHVDCTLCLHIVNLDHAFLKIEIMNHDATGPDAVVDDDTFLLGIMQGIEDNSEFEALLGIW